MRATYEGSSEENLLAALAPDAEWTEAGFPYAGTYIGPENIIKNASALGQRMARLPRRCRPLYDAGDNVIAQGFYHGTYRATGNPSAPLLRIYTLRAGKIVKFVQIVDSAKVLKRCSLNRCACRIVHSRR
ncbi:nuclear transport factor 2 family protein [Serratia marcescens]|uniref:Nuclear transport factor 2 family protein n=1 Tax=Serratia marcescens TaxID=615 RepID=A0A939NSW4_SERMA|nr:nuclear transport factor 2 family protein [Serratia marcescens]